MKTLNLPKLLRAAVVALFAMYGIVLGQQQWNGSNTVLGAIHRNGNVGIGTNNPAQKLHVHSTEGNGTGIRISYPGLLNSLHEWDLRTSALGFGFEYYLNGALQKSPLFLSNTGNVGIGTSTPHQLLVVGDDFGSALSGNRITIGSLTDDAGINIGKDIDNRAFILWKNEDNALAIGTRAFGSGTNNMFLKSSGNVGIGTTNPQEKLHIAAAQGSAAGLVEGPSNAYWVSDAKTFGSGLAMRENGQNKAFAYWSIENQSFSIEESNAARLVIKQGNVGIGTTSPAASLHVKHSASGYLPNGVTGLFVENNGSTNNHYVFQTATAGGGESFTITNAGNVGIGTVSPKTNLHVYHSASGETPTNVTGLYVENNGSANNSYVLQTATAGGGKSFTITNAGKVGIGTTAPSTRLHVEDGSDAEPGSGGYFMTGQVNGSNLVMDNNEIMARDNGAATTLHLNADGGTVAIGAKGFANFGDAALAVNGRILSQEVKVELAGSWPDYVFDEDYQLMPLDELEQSIRQNKHLPDVPSAQEVEASGVALGEMQAKLLQKIEELTLYVINLKKENEALKQRVSSLGQPQNQQESGR